MRFFISPNCPPLTFLPFWNKKEFMRRLVGKYLTANYINLYIPVAVVVYRKASWNLKTLQMLILFLYLFLSFDRER